VARAGKEEKSNDGMDLDMKTVCRCQSLLVLDKFVNTISG
jgi:hypothetical protein